MRVFRDLAAYGLMLACGSFVLCLPGEAVAQSAGRTFVSSSGTDNSACAVTAPCKTISAAVSAVQSGGEVYCLSSGGYGAVTINKSVSIICDNVNAAVTATNGNNAVSISVGTNDKVVLQGLHISGLGSGNTGVSFLSGASLLIDHCFISGFQQGIIAYGFSTVIKDSTIFGNNAGLQLAFTQQAQNSIVQSIIISGSEFVGNPTAFSFSYSPYRGILSIDKSKVINSNVAFNNTGGSVWNVSLSGSVVANNAIFSNGFTDSTNNNIMSYGNNQFTFNGGSAGATTGGYAYVGPQ